MPNKWNYTHKGQDRVRLLHPLTGSRNPSTKNLPKLPKKYNLSTQLYPKSKNSNFLLIFLHFFPFFGLMEAPAYTTTAEASLLLFWGPRPPWCIPFLRRQVVLPFFLVFAITWHTLGAAKTCDPGVGQQTERKGTIWATKRWWTSWRQVT